MNPFTALGLAGAVVRGQLILHMLLTLDAKSDALLGSREAARQINTSDIVEVLAIYQKQTQAALRRTETILTQREGHLTELYEDVLGVVLTMRGGEKKRFMQDGQDGDVTHGSTDGMPQSRQMALRLRSDIQSSSTEPLLRQIMDRFDVVGSPYEDTYDWIFSDSEQDRPWSSFPQWLGAPESSCYWISGKAGSGKSTLMKHIWQDARMLPLLDTMARDGSASLHLGRELATMYLHRASMTLLNWAWGARNPSPDAPRRYARLVEICRYLLQQGADPNQESPISGPIRSVWGLSDELGEAGLGFVEGLTTLLTSLVSHGADVNYQTPPHRRSGDTSALAAVQRFFSSLEIATAGPGEEHGGLHIVRDAGQQVLDLMVSKGALLNGVSQKELPDKGAKRRNPHRMSRFLSFVNRLKP